MQILGELKVLDHLIKQNNLVKYARTHLVYQRPFSVLKQERNREAEKKGIEFERQRKMKKERIQRGREKKEKN